MDQKFLEAYIDSLVGTINDLQLRNVQYQAQAKIHENESEQFKKVIADTINHLNTMESNAEKYSQEVQDLKKQLEDYDAVKAQLSEATQKLSHMNTFQNEVGRLNNVILQKDAEIGNLNEKIRVLTTPVEKPKTKRVVKPKETGKTE